MNALSTVRAGLVALALAALLAGCSPQPKIYLLERQVHETWDHCVYVVPDLLKIESHDRKTVRFSYVLRVRLPGNMPAAQVECPADKRLLLEALSHKDMADLQMGEVIPVEEETSY